MTDLAWPDFVDGATVLNEALLDLVKPAVNSKRDKVGSIFVTTTAPTAATGEDEEYCYDRVGGYFYGPKAAGVWPAGVLWGADAYVVWRENGNTGPSGGTTVDDFIEDITGEDGTSLSVYEVSVEPDPGDMEDGAIYLVQSVDAPKSYNTAGGVTYSVADLKTGHILRDCNGAGRTDTLPTAALLVAGLTDPAVGQPVEFILSNVSDAAETITLAVGSGGSWSSLQVAATRVVPQFHQKIVRLRLTNVTASTEAYVAYL